MRVFVAFSIFSGSIRHGSKRKKMKKQTALLSAFDKTGLETFAGELVTLGWDILASGGTATYLAKYGIPVRDVAEIVGEPILGHRVVTLSREIHAALLAKDTAEDQAELDRLGIPRIDLVYVTLYPLREEILSEHCTLESVIEKTDIGGPTLLRSAAKGRRIALSRKEDLQVALRYIQGGYADDQKIREQFISSLACIAEKVIADYCQASSGYHQKIAGATSFSFLTKQFERTFA